MTTAPSLPTAAVEQICAVLRRYSMESEVAADDGDVIYEADYAEDILASILPVLRAQWAEEVIEVMEQEPIPYGASFVSTSDYMAGRAHMQLAVRKYIGGTQ